MQTNRMFEIIYILLNKKSVTAKELAERFGVSTRTIYRDVDTISLAGIPIYTEQGKGGGISLLPEFVLNKSVLSEQEQNEILLALQGLSNVKTAETNQVLQKLSTIFNKTVANWMEVDFSDWRYTNAEFFNGFKTAILERRMAEFDYYSGQGEKTYRRIEPIQLWFKSRAWYIKGFCLTRQNVRLFKLTRVGNLIVTNAHFSERDLLAIPPNTGPVERQRPDVTLKMKIAPEMTHRVFDEFGEDMVERQTDGGFIATVIWPEDEWMYGFLLSFGEHVEVLEPEHVRESVREKAQKMVEKYL